MNAGDVIDYKDIENHEGFRVQRGMNYQTKYGTTVVLMSVRKGAPYQDEVSKDGRILIYEGHNVPSNKTRHPKLADQELCNPNGTLTENGKFYEAAKAHKKGKRKAELVRVYEKMKKGIWVFNGVFRMVDARAVQSDGRRVYKFRMEITDLSVKEVGKSKRKNQGLKHNRLIPPHVKQAVWKRDAGRCKICGKKDNLHFDHILPFAKGGTSLLSKNIQLLCARHNLKKRDKIE